MTEAVISSSILIAIIILIRTVFKGKLRSSVRYALWLIAAARLMLPFSLVQSPISVMNAAETVISVNQADEIVQPTEAELYIPESVAEQTLNEASPMNVEKASQKEVRTAVRRAVTAVMLQWFCAVNVRFYLLLRKNRKTRLKNAAPRLPVRAWARVNRSSIMLRKLSRLGRLRAQVRGRPRYSSSPAANRKRK